MAADVLYVTFDGVLQPLAFSQVVRVVAGLGLRGFRYHLMSLEGRPDANGAELSRGVDEVLRAAGVSWTALRTASAGGAAQAVQALARATAEALAIARRERIQLVHARGYHGGLVALAVRRLLGLPYVFDARGYWIEERSGPGGWFATPAAYAAGKCVEQALFRGAEAVVTLTELQAYDVASGLFGPPPRALAVIPTCADYNAFYLRDSRPEKPVGAGCVPEEIQRRLAGKVVIGIVGALNGTYFIKETLALAKRATSTRDDVHLLVLSAQGREYEDGLRSIGFSPSRYTVTAAAHSSMPDWLQWIDWGILLVPESVANRAKMPTKLAEFFAAGVRPLWFGCNSDASRWVLRAGSGHVLQGLDENELESAARHVIEAPVDGARLRAAREITAPHFSLASGLDRYDALLSRCLSAGRRTGDAGAGSHGQARDARRMPATPRASIFQSNVVAHAKTNRTGPPS